MRGLEVVSPKPPPPLGDDASDYLLHPLDQLVIFFQQTKVDKKKNDNYFFSAKIYYWVGAPQQSMSQMADSCSRVSIMVHFLKGNKGWSTNAGLNRSLEIKKFKKTLHDIKHDTDCWSNSVGQATSLQDMDNVSGQVPSD